MLERPLRIKLIADAEFAEEMKAAAAANPDELSLDTRPVEKDATKLGFDLATAVQIVAVIKGAMDIGGLAKKIFDWSRDSAKKKNRVVVLQTPFQTLELRSNSDITESQMRDFLLAAAKVVK